MKDYWGITDNSISTRQRYDLIAEHQYKAYSEIHKRELRKQRENAIISNIVLGILWYVIVQPAIRLVKFIFWTIIRLFRAKNRNKRPKNGENQPK